MNPSDWPKPFKVLKADIYSYKGDTDRMADEFENLLTEWTAAGFHLYAGGFHPDGGTFWALMYRKLPEQNA